MPADPEGAAGHLQLCETLTPADPDGAAGRQMVHVMHLPLIPKEPRGA